MIYPVAEKFLSINGEGARAGELAVFVRLRGCNLHCGYCDTMWANTQSAAAVMMTENEICDFADGTANVTITGGEPMLHDLAPLCKALIKKGHNVEIETNGSVSIEELASKPYRPSFTLDYKLPSSGMEAKMCLDNYAYINENDTVKFVAGSRDDLGRALEIIERYALVGKCKVYLSPVFGSITAAEIVEFMKDHSLNGVRVQLQLHKYIWEPEKRGV